MKNTIRLKSFFAVLLVAVFFGLPALSVEPTNTNGTGYAIGGYDPVAYFSDGEPVKGSPDFKTEWNGAVWLFASAEHRDKFASAPEKYAPKYGGYCAWAVAEGYTATINPDVWQIVDGSLYLNYSRFVKLRWQANKRANIARADANWPGILAEK